MFWPFPLHLMLMVMVNHGNERDRGNKVKKNEKRKMVPKP